MYFQLRLERKNVFVIYSYTAVSKCVVGSLKHGTRGHFSLHLFNWQPMTSPVLSPPTKTKASSQSTNSQSLPFYTKFGWNHNPEALDPWWIHGYVVLKHPDSKCTAVKQRIQNFLLQTQENVKLRHWLQLRIISRYIMSTCFSTFHGLVPVSIFAIFT